MHTKLITLSVRKEGAGTSSHKVHAPVWQDRRSNNFCTQNSSHYLPGEMKQELLHTKLISLSGTTEAVQNSAHKTHEPVCQDRGSKNLGTQNSETCLPEQREQELLHTKLTKMSARTEGAGTPAQRTHEPVCQDRERRNFCTQNS